MATAKVTYLGDLRTTSTHLKSSKTIITDAPTDNHGKGEAFSPTDSVASALAACMLTIMGIKANDKNLNIKGSYAEVTKIMTPPPRSIGEIVIKLNVKGNITDEKTQQILINAATTCPVAKSLSPELKQTLTFTFID